MTCVTIMRYESYIDNSSYTGAPRLAQGDIETDGNSSGAADTSAIGRGEVGGGPAEIYETCWRDLGSARSVISERFLARVKGIADTGFIVAFGNRDDAYHGWAASLALGLKEPLLTCEAVLAEASFHLSSTSYVLSLLRDGLLRLAFDFGRNFDQLSELANRYEDRKPDLADLCLIRMSELYPKHLVVTVDVTDFSVYRRNKREAIPVLFPPNS